MNAWTRWVARMFGLALMLALAGCPEKPKDAPAAAAATAPAITTAPATQTLTEGAAANFTVVATGTAPLAYQWQRDGVNIAGATAATYTLAATSLADSGAQLRVVVTNSAGTATSSAAVLTVAELVIAPTITVAPQAASTLDGSSSTFSVVAQGTTPFSYVWQRNGTAIAGASSASYTTPELMLADSGAQYRVVVSNSAGNATSNAATLTVNALPPAVTSAPASVAVTAGQTANFNAAATGSAPLGYQWQRNGTAIAGATAASYTTAATTLADSGARYRVVVTNGGGNATSADAVLTVSAAPVAPAIAAQPQNAAVLEAQTATFSASATGTAPLSYQWRRNGADIASATSSSYTTPALTPADSSARYSLRVSNSAGAATSSDAVLTVQAAASVLANRGWATSQSLETDDGAVSDTRSVIDDTGRATVVFRKVTATRTVIYATRGTPNAAGAAPTWTTPVPIDLLGGAAVSTVANSDMGLEVSPAGNVVAYWSHRAACSASTYQTNGNCTYYYSARFLASSNGWEAPVLVGDTPNTGFTLRINDLGDIAMLGTSWGRSATGTLTKPRAVFLRAAGAAAFRRVLFGTDPIANPMLDIDAAGNLLLAVEASQNGTVDLVAYRGTVAAGFGAGTVLDTRGAAVALQLAGLGVNGQQVIVWAQNNGTQDTNYAATSRNAGDAFAVVDVGYRLNTSLGYRRLTIADDGAAIVFDLSARKRLRWSAAAGWSAVEALPAALPVNNSFFAVASTRNGDLLSVQLGGTATGGDWASYDARRNVLVQGPPTTSPSAGYVLGFSKNGGFVDLNLSLSGLAIVTMENKFDVMPTPVAPAGDGRAIVNLWASFFK